MYEKVRIYISTLRFSLLHTPANFGLRAYCVKNTARAVTNEFRYFGKYARVNISSIRGNITKLHVIIVHFSLCYTTTHVTRANSFGRVHRRTVYNA